MQLYFRLYSPKADLQYPFSIPSVSCYQNMCIISHHRKVNKILPKLQGAMVTSYLICYLLTYFNFFLCRLGHLQLEATWHQEGPHHSCWRDIYLLHLISATVINFRLRKEPSSVKSLTNLGHPSIVRCQSESTNNPLKKLRRIGDYSGHWLLAAIGRSYI